MIALTESDAEAALAAVAAHTPYAAQLARFRGVRPCHFYSPPLARVFGAAVDRVDRETIETRLAALAAAASVSPAWLGDLIAAPRRCLRDESGAYARRVLAAAERRKKIGECAEALVALGCEIAVAA